jgi:hypothetical protein
VKIKKLGKYQFGNVGRFANRPNKKIVFPLPCGEREKVSVGLRRELSRTAWEPDLLEENINPLPCV